MPFYLKEVDVVPEVAKFQSVLIVPCRLCPAVSLAVRKNRPFIQFSRNPLRTECYEDHIANLQSRLEDEGVQTEVFRSSILNYAHCMWTPRKREKLLKRISEFDAVVVLGCEAAYESVCDLIKSIDCQVFNGMESEGLLNVIPKINWPFNISLELSGVTETTMRQN
jgi:hypothetical protein